MTLWLKLGTVATALGILWACSSMEMGDMATDGAQDTDGAPNTAESGDSGDEPIDKAESAAYWTVTGSVDFGAGVVIDAVSALVITQFDVDQDELCAFPAGVPQDAPDWRSDEVELYGWWKVDLRDGVAGCRWDGDATLTLGLGPVDDALSPAIAANGLGTATAYGLYAQNGDAAVVYVFGLAGTESDFSGGTTPVEVSPLPDGNYELRGLHLLPAP